MQCQWRRLALVRTFLASESLEAMLWRLCVSSSSIEQYRHGEEPWAIVTGASDGIGKGLARVLAERQFNVLLHGRNPDKLNAVKDTLAAEFPRLKFEIVVADIAQPDLVSEVVRAVEGKNLTILINNAGYTSTLIQPFVTLSAEETVKGTLIGVTWVTKLTHALFPKLIATQPSLIVSVGSFVQAHPLPFLSIYCGAKGYLRAFSDSLRAEAHVLDHRGLEIQYHEVHGVATKSNDIAPPNLFRPEPYHVASAIVRAVARKSAYVVPYWPHELTAWILWLLPEWLVLMFGWKAMQGNRTDLKKRD